MNSVGMLCLRFSWPFVAFLFGLTALAQTQQDLQQLVREERYALAKKMIRESEEDGQEIKRTTKKETQKISFVYKEIVKDLIASRIRDEETAKSFEKGQEKNKRRLDFLQFLIDQKKVNPNWQTDDEKLTPLIFALIYDRGAMAEQLLQHPDFNPQLADHMGVSAGMYAVGLKNDNILAGLLRHPEFDPNTQNKLGTTAAIIAAHYGYFSALQKIIDHPDMDPNLRDLEGQNVAMWIIENTKAKNEKEAETKAEKEKEKTLTHLLIALGEKGAQFLIKNRSQKTVIDLLEEKGFSAVAQELKDRWFVPLEATCLPEEIDEHLVWQKDVEQATTAVCSVGCSDEALPVGHIKSPAHCACLTCLDCMRGHIYFLMNDFNAPLKCPGTCQKTIVPSYLKVVSVDKEARALLGKTGLQKIFQRQYEKRLKQRENFIFCPTPDCAGGRTVLPNDTVHFSCPECGEDNLLKGKNIGQLSVEEQKSLDELLEKGRMCPPDTSKSDSRKVDAEIGRYRPCYYCGKITERIDGCNLINCEICKKKWDWNKGLYDGKEHSFDRGVQEYTPLKKPWP